MAKTTLTMAVAVIAAAAFGSCHTLDDRRIPVAETYLVFHTLDDWNIYGIGTTGAMSHRRFIRQERVPANYPYTAAERTGYGGILLVGDTFGNPMAYDLSCPVECKPSVRIEVDPKTYEAVCPVCHSSYDVFSMYGHPTSGPAAERGWGLRRYRCGQGVQGQYMIITN